MQYRTVNNTWQHYFNVQSVVYCTVKLYFIDTNTMLWLFIRKILSMIKAFFVSHHSVKSQHYLIIFNFILHLPLRGLGSVGAARECTMRAGCLRGEGCCLLSSAGALGSVSACQPSSSHSPEEKDCYCYRGRSSSTKLCALAFYLEILLLFSPGTYSTTMALCGMKDS